MNYDTMSVGEILHHLIALFMSVHGMTGEEWDELTSALRKAVIREEGRKKNPPVPTDWVQVKIEALWEWFDEKWARIAMPGERDRFVALIRNLVHEVRLHENQKARVLVPMHPIEPTPGQIEKSEMYQQMLKKRVYWKNRYELAVRGMTDKAAIEICGREP